MNPKGMPATGGILAILLLAGCAGHHIAPTTKETATTTNQVPKETGNATNQEPLRIVVSFSEKAHPTPISGRILLFMCHSEEPEPARGPNSAFFWDPQPVFGIDVTNLSPGVEVVFDRTNFRYPKSLAFFGSDDMPPGTYYAQALVDLDNLHAGYHNPGNLYSPMVKCQASWRHSWDEQFRGGNLKLVMDKTMGEDPPVKDTDRVKGVEIRSKLLSDFYGREVMLRAGVVLPSTFREKPNQQFPALYEVPASGDYTDAWWWPEQEQQLYTNLPPPQMLRVYVGVQGPLGHTLCANSANNGPVGDALVQELIPEIEKRFRAIPHGYARFLKGLSSGGWASLWLQVNYPDFFGGCWSMSPDPVDFRAFQTMNIYEDKNGHWTREGYPRPLARSSPVTAKVVLTFPQIHWWEYVIGDAGLFDPVFSPRGADGRPQRLINPLTGRIDPEVAAYWKRYDIVSLLKQNWGTLAPKLKGKLHVVAGGSDTYYLDAAVDNLRDFLRTTDYGGYVEIHPGGHDGYLPMDRFEREIAEHFAAALKASPQSSATTQGISP